MYILLLVLLLRSSDCSLLVSFFCVVSWVCDSYESVLGNSKCFIAACYFFSLNKLINAATPAITATPNIAFARSLPFPLFPCETSDDLLL